MSLPFDPDLEQRIHESGVIAVLIIDDAERAVPLARALLSGGITAMELTLRTAAALEALQSIRQEVPEMIAGAGTVLTTDQVQAVTKAGAAFAVAPGFNPRILAAAREAGISFAPGVATPTDIELAVEQGCRLLKFFPALPMGGMDYLSVAGAPYAHLGLRYIPLGGISASNMDSWISNPMIAAIGGSWIAPRPLIQKGDWPAITALALEASGRIHEVRKASTSA